VRSVLSQTHTDLTVVVVNDGDPNPPWERLAHFDDPRLVRFDLPANRGRYFADEVVLEATRSPYFLVQDADDWSEPTRVEVLLRAVREEHSSGAISSHRRHREGSSPAQPATVQHWPNLTTPLGGQLRHLANYPGLFRCDALRDVGGFYGGFRIGYDTLLLSLLQMAGRVRAIDQPLYNVLLRRGSLTTSQATGQSSRLRGRVRGQLDHLYRRAFRSYRAYLAGTLDEESLTRSLREVARAHVTDAELAELRDQAQRLGAILRPARSSRPAVLPAPPPPQPVRPRIAVSRTQTPDPYRFLEDRRIRWGDWTISKAMAVELTARLERLRPRRILELGSGVSSAVLASYAARQRDALVISLEHDPIYHQRTSQLLNQLDLDNHLRLRLAPLRPWSCPDGAAHPWYDVELEDGFEFVLVDGPPLRQGRTATLFALDGHLGAGWEVWINDGHRQHEQDCVQHWRGYLRFGSVLREVDDRGLWILEDRQRSPQVTQPAIPDGLAVSILTGGRPDLLRRTVESLIQSAPQLLSDSYVVVMVNGSDGETEAYVDGLPFVDRVLSHRGRRLPVGVSTSRLMAEVAGHLSARYLLHLEDDWATSTLDDSWLERACAILRTRPHIGQVRLRHRSQQVLQRHMVSGLPIGWEQDDGFLWARSAHLTFNPSLLRSTDLPRIFPCRDEADAQRRFLRTGFGAAQLTPGVFRHLGARRSLRLPGHRHVGGRQWTGARP
jgi:Glycosyl transferase family 2/Methyltransferase domain